MNPNDLVISLEKAATIMKVKPLRARAILSRSGVRPVRTWKGLGYREDDVIATFRSAS